MMLKTAILPILAMLTVEYGLSIVLYANECPSEETWQFRADQLECNNEEDETYHCILDYDDQLLETCLRRQEFHTNGGQCPWVYLSGEGEILFGSPLTKCYVPGCPSSINSKYFYSDELFKFPKCLIPTSTRNKQSNLGDVPPFTNARAPDVPNDVVDNGDLESNTSSRETFNSLHLVIGILSMLLALSFLMHVWYFWKIKRITDERRSANVRRRQGAIRPDEPQMEEDNLVLNGKNIAEDQV